MDKPIFFSVIITIAAFIPLFTMQGVEGQIFGPMSRTYAYALLGAVIATFTVTPVMSSLLLPERVTEVETILVRGLRSVYERVLVLAVKNARFSAMIALAFLVLCGGLGMRLGTEFLPKLEEGNLWIRALLPPTITLEAGRDTVNKIRNVIGSYAPVRTVVSEQGRGEDATDPDGSFVAEFFVPLKPFDEWPNGLTKPKLVKEMSARLESEFIGIDFNFSQYIQDNIEEAVSGVKGENSVKIFGRDLTELERLSKVVQSELAKVPGVADPGAFNLLGQPNLVIQVDRAKAARYGITVSDMNTVVQAAIGGQEITRIYEGEMNFPLTVRLAQQYRDNIDAIRTVPVALPNSDPKSPTAYIALGDVAEVRLETGAAYIYRQNTERFVPIKYSVRGRDLGSTVADAQRRIAKNVELKEGYRLEWSGEFGALVEAKKRLAVIIPLSLLLIMMLLYSLVQFHTRQPAGVVGHSVCGLRRNSRTLFFRPELQRVGSRRVHFPVRRVGDGWHPARLVYSSAPGRRIRQGRSHHRLSAGAHAPDLHDRSFRMYRPGAGRNFHRHRLASAAAARLRDRRRHAAVTDLQPPGDSNIGATGHADGAKDSTSEPRPRSRAGTRGIAAADQLVRLAG